MTRESTFLSYVTAMCRVALVAAIAMPDARRRSHLTAEEAALMDV